MVDLKEKFDRNRAEDAQTWYFPDKDPKTTCSNMLRGKERKTMCEQDENITKENCQKEQQKFWS